MRAFGAGPELAIAQWAIESIKSAKILEYMGRYIFFQVITNFSHCCENYFGSVENYTYMKV